MTEPFGRDYFARVYATDDDPWRFESAWYERRKQALTMALLPRQRYTHAFEPGCASGEITRLLSARVDHVTAVELMPRIAARAATRLVDCDNVDVRVGVIPEDWPDQRFDLILLSEVAYYVDATGLTEISNHVDQTLVTGGDLVAVHYVGATDYPLTGTQVHALLTTQLGYTPLARYTEHDFAALVLRK
jgi:protein-L-isoaspartate O-methyltransferase